MSFLCCMQIWGSFLGKWNVLWHRETFGTFNNNYNVITKQLLGVLYVTQWIVCMVCLFWVIPRARSRLKQNRYRNDIDTPGNNQCKRWDGSMVGLGWPTDLPMGRQTNGQTLPQKCLVLIPWRFRLRPCSCSCSSPKPKFFRQSSFWNETKFVGNWFFW